MGIAIPSPNPSHSHPYYLATELCYETNSRSCVGTDKLVVANLLRNFVTEFSVVDTKLWKFAREINIRRCFVMCNTCGLILSLKKNMRPKGFEPAPAVPTHNTLPFDLGRYLVLSS